MSLLSTTLPKKNIITNGWMMAIITTLFFSVGPIAAKFTLDSGLAPATMMMLRYVLATVLLFLTIGLTTPKLLRIDFKGLRICIAAGLIFGLSFYLFSMSLTRISASIASMIIAVYPVMLLGVLAFRGERLTQRSMVRVALGLLGVYFLIGAGGQLDGWGVLMALGTCATYVAYLLVIQALKAYDGQTVMLYIFATIALLSVGLWVAEGAQWQTPSWSSWFGVGVLVIFTSYIAQICLFAAVRTIGSGQMAQFYPVEVLLTIFWAGLVLREQMTPLQWVGGILILSSMLLAIERIGQARQWQRRLRLRFRM